MPLRPASETRADHPVLSWLVEFAAVLVNRYEVGHDGKAPYERLRGKQSQLLGLGFGDSSVFGGTGVQESRRSRTLVGKWVQDAFRRDHRRDNEGCEASRRKMVR